MLSMGLIYIFTGNGKGKTSAALGMLTRALAHGWRVGWISWYKEASWGISEHKLDTILNKEALKRCTFLPMGKGFYLEKPEHVEKNGVKVTHAKKGVIVDRNKPAEHREAAMQALKKATELIGEVDVLILDEVCNAVSDGLIQESAVLELVKKREETHLVLTGRNASSQLQKVADLVSTIEKIKHPFDVGRLAVKGLDF